MGHEKGSVFVYQGEMYLFERYETDKEHRLCLVLWGVRGKRIMVAERDCFSLVPAQQVDFEKIAAILEEQQKEG